MVGASEPPIRLNKLTTRYDRVEDRIRVDAQVEGGGVQRLWLTQRLCGELVRTLLGYLNRSGLAVSDASPQSQGAVQRHLHQTARIRKKTSAPVSAAPKKGVLLDRLRVRTRNNHVQLLIPLPDGRNSMLVFSLDEARQWLDILYQQYRAAEWQLSVWPDWIRGESGTGTPDVDVRKGQLH